MASLLPLCFQFLSIGSEAIHLTGKVFVVADLETTTLLQSLGLLELLVIGAKEYRHLPNGSLQQVMDSHTEATTHIRHIAIMIDARQQAEAIDDEDVRRGEG